MAAARISDRLLALLPAALAVGLSACGSSGSRQEPERTQDRSNAEGSKDPPEIAGPQVPIYVRGAPQSPEVLLERLSPRLELEVMQTETTAGVMTVTGQCRDQPCRLSIYVNSGAVDFSLIEEREEPVVPDGGLPELREFERPRLPPIGGRPLPRPGSGIPLPPAPDSPPSPTPEPDTEALWADAQEFIALVAPMPEHVRSSAETRGGDLFISVDPQWSVGENLEAIVVGAGARLRYREGRLVGAWVLLPTASPAERISTPPWARVEAEVSALGAIAGDPVLAYRSSPSEGPGPAYPGLVVFTGPPPDSEHEHERVVAGSHHHGRTLFLQMCVTDDQCGGSTCDDNLCTGMTTLAGDLDRGDGNDTGEDDGGDDEGGAPEESDGPQLFDEDIDVDAICGEQTPPDRLAFSSGGGWTGVARNVSRLGLVLDDVELSKNSFAGRVESVRGYTLKTSRGEFQCNLDHELSQPTGPATGLGPHPRGDCYSTLTKPAIRQITTSGGGPRAGKDLAIESVYCVDGFPAKVDRAVAEECRAKLIIAQRYIFQPPQSGQTGNLDMGDAATWNPAIDYVWIDPPAHCPQVKFQDITFRTKIDNDVPSPDVAGFFKDPDNRWMIVATVPSLEKESSTTLAVRGSPGAHDNVHQKDVKRVTELGGVTSGFLLAPPTSHGVVIVTKQQLKMGLEAAAAITIPGCSGAMSGQYKCAHYHWRWGTALGKKFPNVFVPTGGTAGTVLTPASQTVTGRFTKPVSAKDLPIDKFDPIKGSDLQLYLTVTSDAAQDRVHYHEHFFFR
ncbi:MAG: hypothetical protein AAF799_03070 [Myxococcota bacterium]